MWHDTNPSSALSGLLRSTLVLLFLIAPCLAKADIFAYMDLRRDTEATCDMDLDDGTDLFVDEVDEDANNEAWISGLVAELYRGSGEVIGIADQNSFAALGSNAGTIHARGFVSGSIRTGASPDVIVTDGDADGQSRFRIVFRVAAETSYVLTGTIWSSGRHLLEEWWFDDARVHFRTVGFGPEEIDQLLEDGQIQFQREGVLLPGVVYQIEAQADAFARAEYDEDTGTAHSAYGAAGFDFDLMLQSSGVATQNLSFGAFKDHFQ